jgi:hypothetical protein
MGNLTSKQAGILANDFLGMAQSVGEYRYQHFGKLTQKQDQTIKDLHWSILNYSDDLFTLAATLVMNDVETSLKKIEDVTTDIKNSYHHLKEVQKAIEVAAAAVTLGASIISKNPQAITDAIVGLINTWKK